MLSYEAIINERRSVKSYKTESIGEDSIAKLKDFAQNIVLPFRNVAEFRFFKAEPTKTLYLNCVSPPDNVAFLARTDMESITKVGFAGELFLLYAWSLGIHSCWYGHYKLDELNRLMPHLKSEKDLEESNLGYGYSTKDYTEGFRAICISPLGRYVEPKSQREVEPFRVMPLNRKDIEKLLDDPSDFIFLTGEILYALSMASKAPSCANSQMWRFSFEDDYNIIKLTLPHGYKHFKWEHPSVDIGICACHLWLGLKTMEINPNVSLILEDDRIAWYFELS